MLLSVTTMLVAPALASEDNAAGGTAATEDEFCLYQDGRTDTPEIGPLPCDTSRRYMIGHSGFGAPGPSSVQSPDATEGTLASPPAPDVNSDRSNDIEAP
jgi:hypothetical protein